MIYLNKNYDPTNLTMKKISLAIVSLTALICGTLHAAEGSVSISPIPAPTTAPSVDINPASLQPTQPKPLTSTVSVAATPGLKPGPTPSYTTMADAAAAGVNPLAPPKLKAVTPSKQPFSIQKWLPYIGGLLAVILIGVLYARNRKKSSG